MTAPLRAIPGRAPAGLPQFGPLESFYTWLGIPEEFWHKPKRWFGYTVEFVTPNQLAASATRQRSQGVDRDSLFSVVGLAAVVTNTDNTTFVDSPAALVQITIGASQTLFDPAAHFLNVFGRGAVGDGRINYLEQPYLALPGSNITVQIENLDATARHVRILFRGVRVWGT